MSSQGTLSFRKPSTNPKISNTYNQRNPRPLLPRSSQRPTSQPRGTPSPTAQKDPVYSKLNISLLSDRQHPRLRPRAPHPKPRRRRTRAPLHRSLPAALPALRLHLRPRTHCRILSFGVNRQPFHCQRRRLRFRKGRGSEI